MRTLNLKLRLLESKDDLDNLQKGDIVTLETPYFNDYGKQQHNYSGLAIYLESRINKSDKDYTFLCAGKGVYDSAQGRRKITLLKEYITIREKAIHSVRGIQAPLVRKEELNRIFEDRVPEVLI